LDQPQIQNRKSEIAMKHFISISDNTREDLEHVLDVAARLKKQYLTTGKNDPLLAGRTLAMIFEKPSLRTRVSFSVATAHLGGFAMMLRSEEVGLGKREPVKDVARVLSGMCDGIMRRSPSWRAGPTSRSSTASPISATPARRWPTS
jgi:ornithine carbamoyltransferase